jgi:predicted Zn-dependent peptidase
MSFSNSVTNGCAGYTKGDLDYCAIEAISSTINTPTVKDIKRGLFMGLCMKKISDNSVITFVIIKLNEDIIAVNLRHFNILTVIIGTTDITETTYYKSSKSDQDKAFEKLSDILSELVDKNKVTTNKDIIDVEYYVIDKYNGVFKSVDELLKDMKQYKFSFKDGKIIHEC